MYENVEIIAAIVKAAVLINEKSKHNVFVRFDGHVSWIEVTVYYDGWEKDKQPNCSWQFIDINKTDLLLEISAWLTGILNDATRQH